MRRLLVLSATAAMMAVACQFPSCQKGPLVVGPTSARPGELIELHQDHGDFLSYDSLRVTVGGQPARVSRVISNTDLDIVVPMRAPGNVEVHLRDGITTKASAMFAVLDTDCRRFVMKMEANRVTLLRIEPCLDTVNRDVATLNPRLSFDLVDAAGFVLHTASIPHPLETPSEAFSRSGNAATIGRTDPPTSSVFWVRFPNLPNARRLVVYRVPAGLDIKDPLKRDNRVPVDSLQVSIQ
jgi:hypothetical protein